MNFIQKYKLYRNLKKSAPKTSLCIETLDESLMRVDWNYTDGKHTYLIKSFHDINPDFYLSDVALNDKRVETFTGHRAKILFNMAYAVRQKKLGHAKQTVFAITR